MSISRSASPRQKMSIADIVNTVAILAGAPAALCVLVMIVDQEVARWRLDGNLFNDQGESTLIQTPQGWESIKDDNPRVIEGLMSYYVVIDSGDMFHTNFRTDGQVREILKKLAEEG